MYFRPQYDICVTINIPNFNGMGCSSEGFLQASAYIRIFCQKSSVSNCRLIYCNEIWVMHLHWAYKVMWVNCMRITFVIKYHMVTILVFNQYELWKKQSWDENGKFLLINDWFKKRKFGEKSQLQVFGDILQNDTENDNTFDPIYIILFIWCRYKISIHSISKSLLIFIRCHNSLSFSFDKFFNSFIKPYILK